MSDEQAQTAPLKDIVYISIPDGFSHKLEGFAIDPAILLPAEVPHSDGEWHIDDLSWEMILAAMLKILAYDPQHEHAGYYRGFVLAAKPDIVTEMTNTGVFKAKNKDFDIAEEIFKALENLDIESPAHVLNLALLYEDRSDVYTKTNRPGLAEENESLAFEAYRRALEAYPESPDVHYNVAHFYRKQRSYKKVEHHLVSFTALSDDEDRKEEAEQILHEIRSQNLMDDLFTEAYDFIRLGKEEASIPKIDAFLEKNPDVWNGWFLLGWANRRLERYEEGKDAFMRAVELNPTNPDSLNELAICCLELEEFENCKGFLVKALTLEPENTKIISNLGILSLKQGKYDEAHSFFQAVLEFEPDDPIAANYIDYLDGYV